MEEYSIKFDMIRKKMEEINENIDELKGKSWSNSCLFKKTDVLGREHLYRVELTPLKTEVLKKNILKHLKINISELPCYKKYMKIINFYIDKIKEETQACRNEVSALIKEKKEDEINPYYYLRREFYEEYLQSNLWQKKRADCIAYHGNKCNNCGAIGVLDIHHLHYETLGAENPKTDLIPLCRSCHQKIHGTSF